MPVASPPAPAVVDAVTAAIDAGYRVALDGWADQAVWRPLLPRLHAVRLPLDDDGADEATIAQRLAAIAAQPALERHATGVATGGARARGARLGFTHFLGGFYARPEVLGTRTLGMEQATIVRLLGLAADPDVSDRALEDAFRSHPALVHGLLRIVHSAEVGGRGVSSIAEAVRLVGRSALSRWLLILLASAATAYGPLAREAVTSALARARFCELVARAQGTGDPSARFLVGLLSRLDGLLGQPIGTVLDRLPVAAELRDALLHGVGPHAAALELASQWEGGRVGGQTAGAGDASLGHCYAEAVTWATGCLAPEGTAPSPSAAPVGAAA
jgi:EAL and modified HD-GYP domain-containing signal transduction protein